MNILLVGNYVNLRQQSMQRFGEMLRARLTAAGLEVRLVCPPVWLGRLRRGEIGLSKWIGYIDRFVLYPPLLRRQVRWADVVHVCDQVHAVYAAHRQDGFSAYLCLRQPTMLMTSQSEGLSI